MSSAGAANPYLDPGRVRAALRALDVRPARGMGQNFLVDAGALDQIVGAAALSSADTVVEVGPGLGVLTWELVRRAGRVVTVELDRRLADRLRQEFAWAENLTIVEGDILKLPPERLLDEPPAQDAARRSPYKVVANLPYAITSPLLRHFLTAALPPELLVVLVQKEVAERVTAGPGNLSVLAHAIQIYAAPEIVGVVPAGSFHPAPAVDSAVLRLRVRERPAAGDDPEALMRVIKAGFLHARKTLGNALPGGLAAMGRPTTRDEALRALAAAGIDPQRRAETLALDEWAALWEALRAGGG